MVCKVVVLLITTVAAVVFTCISGKTSAFPKVVAVPPIVCDDAVVAYATGSGQVTVNM